MTLVADASVVVAALVAPGENGKWAESVLSGGGLAAPHLMPVEVANILRRVSVLGDLPPEVAALAHADLLSLRVQLFPYEPVAPRV